MSPDSSTKSTFRPPPDQWKTERDIKPITESLLDAYEAPELLIHTPRGELFLEPIGLHVVGNGRVDLRAYPSFSRVKLVGTDDGGWTIMTDSNVPLREP